VVRIGHFHEMADSRLPILCLRPSRICINGSGEWKMDVFRCQDTNVHAPSSSSCFFCLTEETRI
jgi:hypothetical protein